MDSLMKQTMILGAEGFILFLSHQEGCGNTFEYLKETVEEYSKVLK